MEYAAHLPRTPSRRAMLAPIIALVVGAGAATGVYALVDNNDQATPAANVIVVESPAPGTADIPGKNEAATAAAISGSGGVELRGSKASATGTTVSPLQSDTAEPTDPHGPASQLHAP